MIMFISSFDAVFTSLSTTPLSLKRLPSISIPTRGVASGTMKATISVTATGNMIFSLFVTGRKLSITMARSFFVVSSFIIGGWITGTSAIYEYAATAIEPSSCGASFEVRNIAVGPSAPPMIPIEAASLNEKSTPSIPVRLNAQAPRKVTKIPSCAAAPSSKLLGFAIRGPKSVIQPIPKNISGGNI